MEDQNQQDNLDAQSINSSLPQTDILATESNESIDNQNASAKKPKKSSFTLLVVAAIVLLAGGAAAYFAVILPNKPENIWASALKNSANGYDQLVEYFKMEQNVKGTKFDGNFKLTGSIAADGTISGKTYDNDLELKLDVGVAGVRTNLDTLFLTPENSDNPDIFLKIDGFEGLGGLLSGGVGSEIDGLINEINNQWLFIDHTLLDQLQNGDSKGTSLSPEETAKIAEAFGAVNRDYIFSDDPSRAVFMLEDSVGEETRSDRKVYHFTVRINKANLKQYLESLSDRLKETKVKTIFGQEMFDSYFEKLIQNADNVDETQTADVWVDIDTKTIRYIKITDKIDDQSYAELSFLYEGGNEYPFKLNIVSPTGANKGNAEIGLLFNTETNIVKFDMNFDLLESEGFYLTANVTLQPSNEMITTPRPKDIKPATTILYQLLGGFNEGDGSVSPTLTRPSLLQ